MQFLENSLNYWNDKEKHKGYVSYAYLKTIPKFSLLSDSIVLDITFNSIAIVKIDNFQQLRTLRISRCNNLSKITISNCPLLKSLDCVGNSTLKNITITNCPSLEAIDASFCDNLDTFSAELPQLMYLSLIHTKIKKLPLFPRLKFLDISSSKISDLDHLTQLQSLQALVVCHMPIKEYDFYKFSTLRDFTLLQTDIEKVYFSSFNDSSKLSLIWCPNSTSFSGISNYKERSACLPNNEFKGYGFKFPRISGDWHHSHLLLFGPYPPPPNDLKYLYKQPEVFQQSPETKLCVSYILGSLFGTAIGDWLGWNSERLETPAINMMIETSLDPTWSHARMTRRGLSIPRGAFSDQGGQILVFMRSIIETNGILDIKNLAKHFHSWIDNGFFEHCDQKGSITSPSLVHVTSQPDFDKDPFSCSKKYWEVTGKTASGNSSVCRTAPTGCYLFWDDETVVKNAQDFCKITSYDPRCVFATTLISLIISNIIKWKSGLSSYFDVEEVIQNCFKLFPNLSKIEENDLKRFTSYTDVKDLKIGSYLQLALQSMGLALIVVRKRMRFEEGIELAIRSGGDTKGNAAVVGAVLGALWGVDFIPINLLEYFWYGTMLYKDSKQFLALMGL